jgi:hypothetical protein
MSALFSLCIPTLNRFDNFLNKYLESYINFLEEGLIDEIVITDETGDDINKILQKYNDKIQKHSNKIRLYKNDQVLGVFLNKIKVSKLAYNNYVVLIDSDNFVNRDYFETAKNYIELNPISEYFIISPSQLLTTSFNFFKYCDNVYTKKNIGKYAHESLFQVMLNTGNYIISKNIFDKLTYKSEDFTLDKIASCDVIYFNLLVFQQIENVHFYVVKDLKYNHIVHNDSEYIKKNHVGNHYLYTYVIPKLKNLS